MLKQDGREDGIPMTYLFREILVSSCVVFKGGLHYELLIELHKTIAGCFCLRVYLFRSSDPEYIERQIIVRVLEV